jgi:hypothetical protein
LRKQSAAKIPEITLPVLNLLLNYSCVLFPFFKIHFDSFPVMQVMGNYSIDVRKGCRGLPLDNCFNRYSPVPISMSEPPSMITKSFGCRVPTVKIKMRITK